MKFRPFEVHGVTAAGNSATFACVDDCLEVDAGLLLNGVSVTTPSTPRPGTGGAGTSAKFTVPCLALTDLHVAGKEARRGFKRERYREVTVSLTIWDGPTVVSSGIDFADDGEAEKLLALLNNEVAAANLKWPLSSARALAARRAAVPGRLRYSRLLGVQGFEEFISPFDSVGSDVVDAWAASPLAHQWPLGVEVGWSNGVQVYCVALPTSLVWVTPGKVPAVEQIPFSSIERVDLQVRLEDSGHVVAFLVETGDGPAREMWRTYAERLSVQRMYRFALNAWAAQRPFDLDAWLDEVEQLESARSEDRLDAVSHATAVSALARRVAGDLPPAPYPWTEEQYVRQPSVRAPAAAPRPGVNAGQVARAGVGVGLLAAAVSMMDE